MEVRVRDDFLLCARSEKVGETCFRSCFCFVVKRDGENRFLLRGNFDVTLKTGCNESRFPRETFFTANLDAKDRRISSICENPS